MKFLFYGLNGLVLSGFMLISCKNDPSKTAQQPGQSSADRPPAISKSVEAQNGVGQAFKITAGEVSWVGSMMVGKQQHFGVLKVGSGQIWAKDGLISGGEATLDMTSIACTDLDGADRKDLEDHLKNGDFFDVKKFPTGQFTLLEVLPANQKDFNAALLGELTLKGIKKPVSIPANVKIDGKKLTIETNSFPLKRTDWGINYSSSLVEKVKDKIINDIVLVRLKIEATAE